MVKKGKIRRARAYWKKSSRRKKSHTIAVLPLLGLGATAIPSVRLAIEGKYEDALNTLIGNFTGYSVWDGQFHWDWLAKGWAPVIAGVGGHFVANKVGLNRNIRKIPMVGKYISL